MLGAYGLSSFALVAPALRSLSRKSPGSGSRLFIQSASHSTAIYCTPRRRQSSLSTVGLVMLATARCPSKAALHLCPRDKPPFLLWPPQAGTIWSLPCHQPQSLPPSSPPVFSHIPSPLHQEHLVLCSWPPASACPLPKMVWLCGCFSLSFQPLAQTSPP